MFRRSFSELQQEIQKVPERPSVGQLFTPDFFNLTDHSVSSSSAQGTIPLYDLVTGRCDEEFTPMEFITDLLKPGADEIQDYTSLPVDFSSFAGDPEPAEMRTQESPVFKPDVCVLQLNTGSLKHGSQSNPISLAQVQPMTLDMNLNLRTIFQSLPSNSALMIIPIQVPEQAEKEPVKSSPHTQGYPPEDVKDEKPFKCRQCKQAFKAKFSLTRHMKKHTKEKPHACAICGRSFAEKSSRKRHLQIHTGEKPFPCRLCGRPFGDNVNLKRHLGVVHNLKKQKFKRRSSRRPY